MKQETKSAAVRTAGHLVRGEQLVGWFLRTLYPGMKQETNGESFIF